MIRKIRKQEFKCDYRSSQGKACKQGLGNGNGTEKKELSIFQCGINRAS